MAKTSAATAGTSLKTASVLAFERKLDPSDATFTAGLWGDRAASHAWPAVTVREKSVRGTISNRLKTKGKDVDVAKLDADIQNPNLQRVDVATLPPNADTLRVRFTLRVLGGAGNPSACNSAEYQRKLATVIGTYVQTHGFGALARRYAGNLANARFLWRNRFGAEQVEVIVRRLEDGRPADTWAFADSLALSTRTFDAPADATAAEALESLSARIADGLAGRGHTLLEVVAHARVGDGQEVFPSQELILDKGGAGGKGTKSKTLYQIDGTAGMHSQKVGNALRTIDTWYPDADADDLGPISIEPYGSVTSRGKAYRQPGRANPSDFYSLLDAWVLRNHPLTDEEQHFVMANLVRGGVFGDSDKD